MVIRKGAGPDRDPFDMGHKRVSTEPESLTMSFKFRLRSWRAGDGSRSILAPKRGAAEYLCTQ